MSRSSIELQTPPVGSSAASAFGSSTTALARSGKAPGHSKDGGAYQDGSGGGSGVTTRPPSPMEEEDGDAAGGHGRHEFSLPPTDSGKDAWMFLVASFVMEAFVWGE